MNDLVGNFCMFIIDASVRKMWNYKNVLLPKRKSPNVRKNRRCVM